MGDREQLRRLFHPLHVHLVDFWIVTRDGAPPPAGEGGSEDVVCIGENETVRVLCASTRPATRMPQDSAKRLEEPTYPAEHGTYMVHGHDLTHEDHDVMTQICVGEDTLADDLIKAGGLTDHRGGVPPRRCGRSTGAVRTGRRNLG